MRQRVVMVAFHYPPCAGTSGVHRTLKFSRYLPDYGWDPVVLTAHPAAYGVRDDSQLGDIPPRVDVVRAFSLDAGRHLAIRGRYPIFAALPDRWGSWAIGATLRGLQLLRRYRPAVIWSTYPIATAHVVAMCLHRLSGIPWVADFRDPMTEDGYPADVRVRTWYERIERRVMTHAARIVFTTSSARDLYATRYESLSPERCLVIPNGYDEEDFASLDTLATTTRSRRCLRMVHAGVLYPQERDPRAFFRALANLKTHGTITSQSLRVELRAPGSEPHYAAMLQRMGISDIVHILPPLAHHAALHDCADSDALLLLQGPSCNRQIPAKTYEYLRLRRPILALTDPQGDTGVLLRTTGGATIAPLEADDALSAVIPRFLTAVQRGTHTLPDVALVARYSRRQQTRVLTDCLKTLVWKSDRCEPSVQPLEGR